LKKLTRADINKYTGEDIERSHAYGTLLSEIKGLTPERTVLLMIDMQKAFVEPGAALCIKGAKATVPACEAALERILRNKSQFDSAIEWNRKRDSDRNDNTKLHTYNLL